MSYIIFLVLVCLNVFISMCMYSGDVKTSILMTLLQIVCLCCSNMESLEFYIHPVDKLVNAIMFGGRL